MKTFPLLFSLSHAVFALEPVSLPSLTIGSKTYESATLTREGELGVKISHASGIARAQLADLAPEVREKLGVDPARQAAAEQKQTETQRIAGLRAERERERARMIGTKEAKELEFIINELQPGGVVGGPGRRTEFHAGVAYSGITHSAPSSMFIQTKMDKGRFFDGKRTKFTIVRDGTHTYTTVLGASRTIPKWVDVELILDAKFPDTARAGVQK